MPGGSDNQTNALDVAEPLIRDLLAAQAPAFSPNPLTFVSQREHAVFRLGDDRCVRLPRDARAALHDQGLYRWLDAVASRLPVPIPKLALAAPTAGSPCWIHRDLTPEHVLTREGRISAIIDPGELSAGDPAADLASVWLLFDSQAARADALQAYFEYCNRTPGIVRRARGWAVHLALLLHARALPSGAAALRRLHTDAADHHVDE